MRNGKITVTNKSSESNNDFFYLQKLSRLGFSFKTLFFFSEHGQEVYEDREEKNNFDAPLMFLLLLLLFRVKYGRCVIDGRYKLF